MTPWTSAARLPTLAGELAPDEIAASPTSVAWWRTIATPAQQATELDRQLANAREDFALDRISLDEFEARIDPIVRAQDELARQAEREKADRTVDPFTEALVANMTTPIYAGRDAAIPLIVRKQ